VEIYDSLLLGFSVALRPEVLWYAFVGCLVGTLVGMLPGVGPLAGISILLPLTFGLDATKAIVMLAGIYYGSQYGGSTTSILLRIPGEAASVMTCIDGYAMAKKGRAGAALCIAAVGSFIAGTFGVICSPGGCRSPSSRRLRPAEYTGCCCSASSSSPTCRPRSPHVVDGRFGRCSAASAST
jgi:TctA family transporter